MTRRYAKADGYNHSQARDRLVEDYIRTLKIEIKRLREIMGNMTKSICQKEEELEQSRFEIYQKDQEINSLEERIKKLLIENLANKTKEIIND